jgi:hypothetical protein
VRSVISHEEKSRLREIRRCGLLERPAGGELEPLVKLTAQVCEAPMAAISLLGRTRARLHTRIGLELEELPRAHAFCLHAIQSVTPWRRVLMIREARTDFRVAQNPLVTGEPYVRFYAGAPLVTANGVAIGALQVFDTRPRKLSPEQLEALEVLARQVITQLELYRNQAAPSPPAPPEPAAPVVRGRGQAPVTRALQSALVSIELDCEVLREGIPRGDQSTRAAVESIERSARQMRQLLSDLLPPSARP